MGRFRDTLLARKEFVYTCEFVPGRGRTGKNVEECIEFGKFCLLLFTKFAHRRWSNSASRFFAAVR